MALCPLLVRRQTFSFCFDRLSIKWHSEKIKITRPGIRQYSSCINLNDPYVIAAARTPFGSFQGKLSALTGVDLGAKALTAAIEKSCLPKDDISEFILGCHFLAGMGQSPARHIALSAGLPTSVITSTINKLCASSMKAIMLGSQMILSNYQEVVAVGGVESLSNVPFILKRKIPKLGNICVSDLINHDGMYDFIEQGDLTEFAEITAKDYKVGRAEQDEYGIQSYNKAAAAAERGIFAEEIVPIVIKHKGKEDEVICEDQEIKRLDMSKYYELVPEVGKEGTITVGNSSNLSDGACMLILASGNYVLKKSLKPLARIVSFADGAVEQKQFCLSPAVTIPRALVRANLTTEHISYWEISETFALTPLVNGKLLKLDMNRVNRNGGAISLGHPFGATGARLVGHLALTLAPGELGCAAISHGSGGGSAIIVEKL